MGAPTIYRWDDADAPVLSGTPGSLINLLRKCLVEGYGSKAAAGWSMPFISVDEITAVFRGNAVASFGRFFKFIDDSNGTKMCGYETMSDIDNGLGRIPGGNSSTSYKYIYKSTSADGSMRPWVMIADSCCFYIYTRYSTTDGSYGPQDNTGRLCFVGDMLPTDPANTFLSGVVGGDSVSDWVMFPVREDESDFSRDGVVFRNTAGTIFAPTVGLYCLGYTHYYPGSGGVSGQINGQYLFYPCFVSGTLSEFSPAGVYPGMYVSSHKYDTFDNFQVINEGGKELYCLHTYVNGAHAQCFVDISAGFRP
jgi:hypothetical protein